MMAELGTIRAYTVDEFIPMLEALTDEDTHRLEVIAGELIEVSPSKAKQTSSAAVLLVYMGSFVLQNHLGYLTDADGDFKLSKEDFFAPDAAFIAKEKLPYGQPNNDFYSMPPDLAIEVLKPNNTLSGEDVLLGFSLAVKDIFLD